MYTAAGESLSLWCFSAGQDTSYDSVRYNISSLKINLLAIFSLEINFPLRMLINKAEDVGRSKGRVDCGLCKLISPEGARDASRSNT